jgi:hypothetical protein
MKRFHPVTGEIFLPYRFQDGRYRVADPALGKVKHHSKNQILVETDQELRNHVRRGFHVRMRGDDSGQVNLIKPDEIVLTEVGSHLAPAVEAKVTRKTPPSPISVTSPRSNSKTEAMPKVDGLLPCHGRFRNRLPVVVAGSS